MFGIFKKKNDRSSIRGAGAIVREYGRVLEETASAMLSSVSLLPHTKEEIGSALKLLIKNTPDGEMRTQLRTAYLTLAKFQEMTPEQISDQAQTSRAMNAPLDSLDNDELREVAKSMVQSMDATLPLQSRVTAEMNQRLEELRSEGLDSGQETETR